MAATIIRHARSSPTHVAGPNESRYCIKCQAIMPNGFWLYSQIDIGPVGIFVCDGCLDEAKKSVRTGTRRSTT